MRHFYYYFIYCLYYKFIIIFILFVIIIFKNFYGLATRRRFAEELHSFKKLQNSSKDVVTLYHGSTKTEQPHDMETIQ